MKMHLLALATAVSLFALPHGAGAQDTTSYKGKVSYALGYRAGLDIRNVINSGEQLDLQSVILGLQQAAEGKDPTVAAEQLTAALDELRFRMQARYKAELEARAADNKTKGEAFLAQNRAKPGVNVLPSGVQYRVVEAGTGAKPTAEQRVTVEFRSTLPNGTVTADTSQALDGQPPGPVTVRLGDIPMPGLREALQQMPAGARWEVVLPGSQAHGTDTNTAQQMANQVVLFDIKLISVEPAAPPAGG